MGSSALDQAARAQGFRDFATYQAYQAQQQALRSGVPVGQTAAPVAAQPAPQQPQRNWLENLIDNYTPLGGAMRRIRQVL